MQQNGLVIEGLVQPSSAALNWVFVQASRRPGYPTWREARAELNGLPLRAESWNE